MALATEQSRARRDRTTGYACAGLVVLIWAGFSLASRWATHAVAGAVRLTPWDLAALRFAVAGVVAAGCWAAGLGRGLPLARGLAVAVVGGLCFALAAYVGFSLSPATHAAVLMPGALPFLVAVGTWLAFGERWSRARVLSLALALGGVGLLGAESYGLQSAPPGAWRGDLLFLTASTCWAAYTVLARKWAVSAGKAVTAIGLWCAALFLPLWWAALPSRMAEVAWPEIAFQAVFQGLISVVVSLVLYTRALTTIGTGRLTTITALTPGLAGLAAGPLLGEHIGPLAMAGLSLVCVAVMVGVRGPAPALP